MAARELPAAAARRLLHRRALLAAVLAAGAVLAQEPPAAAPADAQAAAQAEGRLAEILAGDAPRGPEELRAMQAHVQALLARVLPATVSVPGASGVLVERDGRTFVLCAAHVTREADRELWIALEDGRRVRGRTLGADHRADAGLIEVTGPPGAGAKPLPAVPTGSSADLRRGEWVLELGHPGGRKEGRSAPARLGRVLRVPRRGARVGYLVTDCTMQGGDSGGPLFDMQGRVVGINSRINGNLAENMHTPVDALVQRWDALLAGEVTARPRRGRDGLPGFGVEVEFTRGGAVVASVPPDGPAAAAGLLPGDAIAAIAGRAIDGRRAWFRALRGRRAGERVEVTVRREGEAGGLRLELELVGPEEER